MREKEYSIIFSSGIFTGMSRKVLAWGYVQRSFKTGSSNDFRKKEIGLMNAVIGLLFSGNIIFYPISERCSCLSGILGSNGLEMNIKERRSHKFWIPCSSYKQETLSCLKPVLKFHMSITEPFINFDRRLFSLLKQGIFLRFSLWWYQVAE